MDLLDRIIAKTSITREGCWVWTGHTQRGYGIVSVNGKSVRVHRAAWELLRGPCPDGLVADHVCHKAPCTGGDSCPHRACLNPDHIEWVTASENNKRSSYSWRPAKKPKTLDELAVLSAKIGACGKGHPAIDRYYTAGGNIVCRVCSRIASREAYRKKHGLVEEKLRPYRVVSDEPRFWI